MTLSDLWPGFQGHDIFWSRISEKRRVLKTKLLLHKGKIPNIWNGTVFDDLDSPLNTSRWFVSISWASCLRRRSCAVLARRTAKRHARQCTVLLQCCCCCLHGVYWCVSCVCSYLTGTKVSSGSPTSQRFLTALLIRLSIPASTPTFAEVCMCAWIWSFEGL